MASMSINPRLTSMEIRTRNHRLSRMYSLTCLRRLIRFQGCGLGRPNPNPRQIILTMLDRLTRMARAPRLSRVTRLPRHTRLTSITSLDRKTILTRMDVTAGSTIGKCPRQC